MTATFNPAEARDYHGRWTTGAVADAAKALSIGKALHIGDTELHATSINREGHRKRVYRVVREDGSTLHHDASSAADAALGSKKYAAMWDWRDEQSGMHTDINGVTDMGDGHYEISGFMRDSEGSEAGYFVRVVDENSMTVHHAHFELYTKHRGEGIASRFTMHQFDQYRQNGFKRVTVDAGLTHGGYAWAKLGFDLRLRGEDNPKARQTQIMNQLGPMYGDNSYRYKQLAERISPAELADFKSLFATPSELKGADEAGIPDKFISVAQIATYGMNQSWLEPDGETMWPGKFYLRGAEWRGEKIL